MVTSITYNWITQCMYKMNRKFLSCFLFQNHTKRFALQFSCTSQFNLTGKMRARPHVSLVVSQSRLGHSIFSQIYSLQALKRWRTDSSVCTTGNTEDVLWTTRCINMNKGKYPTQVYIHLPCYYRKDRSETTNSPVTVQVTIAWTPHNSIWFMDVNK